MVAEADRRAASRKRRPGDRSALLLRRAMAREVLSRYLDVPPSAVSITRACRHCGDPAHGKPRLTVSREGPVLDFSVSQAGSVTVVAVGAGTAVGADVEAAARAGDWSDVAAHYFTPAEQAVLDATPPADRMHAFLTTWAVKEACLKADGRGLVAGPDAVEVLTPPGDFDRTRVVGAERQWSVVTLVPEPGHVAAVASGAGVDRLETWDWRWPDGG